MGRGRLCQVERGLVLQQVGDEVRSPLEASELDQELDVGERVGRPLGQRRGFDRLGAPVPTLRFTVVITCGRFPGRDHPLVGVGDLSVLDGCAQLAVRA